MSRIASRVLALAAVLVLVAATLPFVTADAAWRRVTRNLESGRINDVAVCTDGIHVVLSTRLQVPTGATTPDQMQREALLVTTGAEFDGQGEVPAGRVLLELPLFSGVMAPRVDADDPRLPDPGGEVDYPEGTYAHYLIEERVAWSEPVDAGTGVHLWQWHPSIGRWVQAAPVDGSPQIVPVKDASDGPGCPLFGEPEPRQVRLDPNVFSPRDEVHPQFPNLTVFSVKGAELREGSIRFGAPGHERRAAWVFRVGDQLVGVADLTSRGLGCNATEASVTALTTAGEVVAGRAVVRPVCPF